MASTTQLVFMIGYLEKYLETLPILTSPQAGSDKACPSLICPLGASRPTRVLTPAAACLSTTTTVLQISHKAIERHVNTAERYKSTSLTLCSVSNPGGATPAQDSWPRSYPKSSSVSKGVARLPVTSPHINSHNLPDRQSPVTKV